jgi:hypothetical protein
MLNILASFKQKPCRTVPTSQPEITRQVLYGVMLDCLRNGTNFDLALKDAREQYLTYLRVVGTGIQ